jgi:putative RecB family exonuclease
MKIAYILAIEGSLLIRNVECISAFRVTSFRARITVAMSSDTPAKLPNHLSPSSIVTWKQCSLLWKLRYIDKLPEPTTTALARGISAHDALQNVFDLPPEQRTEENLHNLFRSSWGRLRKQERYSGLFGRDREQERNWGLESLQGLSRYLQLESPENVEPAFREEKMKISLTQKGPIVLGVIDRIDRSPDGHLVVVDYKTGAAPDIEKYSVATQAKIADEKFMQLRIYALLVARTLGETPKELRLLYLGSCDELTASCNEQDVLRTEQEITVLWEEMVAAATSAVFSPKIGPLCPHCNFKAQCPAYQRR